MTTTYSTDAQVYARSPLAASALSAVNATLTAASQSPTTLDAYRVEAQRQILLYLRGQGITAQSQVTRPEDLQEPEIALALALLYEAAAQRVAEMDKDGTDAELLYAAVVATSLVLIAVFVPVYTAIYTARKIIYSKCSMTNTNHRNSSFSCYTIQHIFS